MKAVSRVWVALAGILAMLAALSLLSAEATGSVPGAAVGGTLSPRVYLPLAARPQPTPFATPGTIQRYHMEYAILESEPFLWMPAPRYWDGNGVRQVSVQTISPPPS